ncbi:MAG TPA: hypothetical protein VJT72_10750 [Pseudonocardiaceae bacterium]|nr:hypothetical protein [Pseudonocardiaceae bacterium]
MSTIAVIGLGILVWILLAIPLGLFVGRMIRLRDRQRPGRIEPGTSVESTAGDAAESCQTPRGWCLHNKT